MKLKYLIFAIVTLFWTQTAIAGSTPFDIDASNVDVFLPPPAISDDCYQLQRSYQPFGESSPINLETAVLRAGDASVRLTQLKLNGENYWIDFLIKISGGSVILDIGDFGLNSPPETFPSGEDFSALKVDFTLASADIFGPPARIRIFDVAINYVLYDLDFTWVNDRFVLTGSSETGFMNRFMNYKTMPDDDFIVFSGQTNDPTHDGSTDYSLSLPRTPFQNPIAMLWSGEDGEHSIRVEYENGSRIQTMVATDGLLRGEYLPPYAPSGDMIFFSRAAQASRTSWLPSWWSSDVSVEEKLDQCIKKKTALFVGLKADPQLSAALVDTVLTVAGPMNLSSSTLTKIKNTIADSKDLVLEMMANGEVDSTTLAVFVSTTIMKNATPEEHKLIIEQIWGNNVPNNVAAIAKSAGAAETNAKLAMKALAEGIASHVFPAYTAAVKLVIKTANYAKDSLGNEAFRELYDVYKDSGGNWDDVNTMSVLATNKFADSTIREILKSQGEDYSNAAIEDYLKEKMENLYARESELEAERVKLNGYKEDYLGLSTSMKLDLENKSYSAENPSTCDMFHKYLDIRSRIELDLKSSSRNCEYGLTTTEIQSQAEFLARYWTRPSSSANKADYQTAKLSWLKNNGCLNFEDDGDTPTPSEHGVWALVDTVVNDWQTALNTYNSSSLYLHEISYSEGSVTFTQSYLGPNTYYWLKTGISKSGLVTWTAPSLQVISPGDKFSIDLAAAHLSHDDEEFSDIGQIYAQYFHSNAQGDQIGGASYLEAENGDYWLSSTYDNGYSLQSATVSGSFSTGSEGQYMAIRVGATNGNVSAKTTYIYEWR